MAKRSPVPQLRTPDCGSVTGVTTTYTYKLDANYVSTETVTRNLSPVTLAVYSYTYRADGLKIAATEYMLNANGSSDTVTLTWNYDALDRLIQEVSVDAGNPGAPGNYTDKYSYDLNSNRTSETIENGSGTVTDTTTSTYNADNQLTQSVDANNGTTTYQYDANGSQTQVVSPTGTFTQQDSYTINPGDTANANLYLYAGADPVNMFDPSGESASGLGQLVHAEIEAMYARSHSGRISYNAMMPGSFGWLFPDIMDFNLGQIAEIKPFSTYGVSTGPVQLGAYLRAANGLAFSWRGHTGPIPPVPNVPHRLWESSTWPIGVVPLEIPDAPDTTAYTLGNFGGIIFYKAFPNDRVPILIEQDAKNLANSLEDVMRNFAGAFDTGLQVGGGLVTALNYELDAAFNNDMALYAAEAGALTVSTAIGIGLFQYLSMATLTAQLAF